MPTNGKGRETPAHSAKPSLNAACEGWTSNQEVILLGLAALGGGN